MSEFTPPWRKVRMTKAQMKKYISDIKKAQKLAQAKLDEAKASWEFYKDEKDLEELEDLLS